MKKKIAYLVAVLVIFVAAALAGSFAVRAGDPSCQGKCHRAYNACIAAGNSPPSCHASYQGCISSCK